MAGSTKKPGPPPSSCLTCRRRRKKCDLSRPCCEMCIKGGHKCLGYDDTKSRAKDHPENYTLPISPQSQPVYLVDPTMAAGSGKSTEHHFPSPIQEHHVLPSQIQYSEAVRLPEDRQDPTSPNTNYGPGVSILGSALLYRIRRPISSDTANSASINSLDQFDRLWPQDPHQQTVSWRSQTARTSRARRLIDEGSSSGSTRNNINKVIDALFQSIPHSVGATRTMREDYVVHVVSQHYSHRVSSWIMNPSPPTRDMFLSQLKGSQKTTWVIYLEANLLRTLQQSSSAAAVHGYIDWIDRLYQQFITASNRNSPLSDLAEPFMVELELVYLKFAAMGGRSGYALLRAATPKFLQLVAADPSLYTEHPSGSLVVSFSRTLGAPHYELRRFLVYDTMSSLVVGVPPLVEYGYDGGCDTEFHGLEWVHGVPVPFLEVISQINSQRAGSRVPLDDWETLEKRVLAWESPSLELDEASGIISASTARFAVQESWRHVTLIYIYMGLCGVSSHDSRVQASVHRIFQLGETVSSLPVGMHMFSHCIVAGLAARLETHRILIYEMLLSFKDMRVWLFRGPPFAQVLYHLWHGAGEGGAPVIWEDYVESMREVAPV